MCSRLKKKKKKKKKKREKKKETPLSTLIQIILRNETGTNHHGLLSIAWIIVC